MKTTIKTSFDPSIGGYSLGHCLICYPSGATAANYPRAASARLAVTYLGSNDAACGCCGTRYRVERDGASLVTLTSR